MHLYFIEKEKKAPEVRITDRACVAISEKPTAGLRHQIPEMGDKTLRTEKEERKDGDKKRGIRKRKGEL